MTTRLPATVEEIGRIHFEGNIIPHPWYRRITLESGKPDMPAIIILAEIVYWYRPIQSLDQSGKPISRKRFDSDMFQCSAAYYEDKFGLTKDQTRKALKRLEEGGYIRREYRDVIRQGILRNCVMFVEPMPVAIMAITHPSAVIEAPLTKVVPPSPTGDPPSPTGDPPSPTGDPPSPTGDPPSPTGDPPSPTGDFFKGIKTTTEISTETTTTTPNPSSTDERAAEPEAVERGSGAQDEQTEDRDGDHGMAASEAIKERLANSENTAHERRAEFAYPAKLTERELEDIAAQVEPLPAEVAQQMLDVIDAKIKAGQVKTNPAAVLRGIVRKYRADPAAFDPSPGFGNAEARRRRAESEARQRAEAERREREAHVSPEARETARKSIASIKRMLRSYA